MPRWIYFLLPFSVIAVLAEYIFHWPALVIFALAAIGIVPLAAMIGYAVEGVAEHTGEQIGGLLFATFGNATELIISIFALAGGLVDVVRASIIGAILGNALLVLGVSVFVGGFKNGRLRFNKKTAGQYGSLIAICLGGLLLPTMAELLAAREHQENILERGIVLSDFISVLLLIGYFAFIAFSIFRFRDRGANKEFEEAAVGGRSLAAIQRLLAYRTELAASGNAGKTGVLEQIDSAVQAIVTPDGTATVAKHGHHGEGKKKPIWKSLLLLVVATAAVAVVSEILVESINPMTELLGWKPAFVGLVFVPIIGALPEYFNTITMALQKRVDMVIAAAAGSTVQIALLVTPFLVLLSLVTVKRMDLVFSIVELAVLGIAAFLFSEITQDGELNWMEGLLLILLYVMMAGTVFMFG